MSIRVTFEIQEKKESKWMITSIFDDEYMAEEEADRLIHQKQNEIRIVREKFNMNTLSADQEVIFTSSVRKAVQESHLEDILAAQAEINLDNRVFGVPWNISFLRPAGIAFVFLLMISLAAITILS